MRTASILCRASLAAMLLMSLAACSGGGLGDLIGGGDDDDDGPPPVPSASVSGKSLVIRVPDVSAITIADKSPDEGTPGAGTVSSDGEKFAVEFDENLDGGTHVPDSGNLTFNENEGEYQKETAVNSTTTRNQHAIVNLATVRDSDDPSTFLQYSAYGEYIDQTGPTDDDQAGSAFVAHFYGGEETDTATLPVTASYSGQFKGLGTQVNGSSRGDEVADLTGDVELTANFTGGSISGSVSNMTQNCDGCPDGHEELPLGLALSGTITGNTYQGSVGFTDGNGVAAGSVTDSTLIGGFYGVGAAETAGALRVEGTTPPLPQDDGPDEAIANVLVQGSFGAKKQ